MNEPMVTFTGNVASTPELKITRNGSPMAAFRVAVTPRRQDRESGEWCDLETVWFSVITWRQLAEHCVVSLGKGDRVQVTGKIALRMWTGDDGQQRGSLDVDAVSVALDLARSSAVSTRRTAAPSPRSADEPATDVASTGGGPDTGSAELDAWVAGLAGEVPGVGDGDEAVTAAVA